MSRLPNQELSKSHRDNFFFPSPIGFFSGQVQNGLLASLRWSLHKPGQMSYESDELAQYICGDIQEYFHQRKDKWNFSFKLPGTPEEQKVYTALLTIPYGETRTYAFLAEKVNKPRSARWIGYVCSKNPLPIIIPCHRVLRKDRIGEYACGGTSAKEWLIQWEKLQVSAGCKPPSLSAIL